MNYTLSLTVDIDADSPDQAARHAARLAKLVQKTRSWDRHENTQRNISSDIRVMKIEAGHQ